MNKEEIFDIINKLAKLNDEDLELVIACAKFQKYLQTNIGEKIDLTTIGAFASLVGKLVY